MAWSVYNKTSGLIVGGLRGGDAAGALQNAGPNEGIVPGRWDRDQWIVDITAQPPPDPDPWPTDGMGQPLPLDPWYPPVIDYIPPAPADDQWQTWAWDAGIKRWVSTPTLLAHKRAARQRMTEAWNAARAAGVTFGTKTAPTDADSWTRYLAIKEMAADGGWVDVPIPLADGTFEMMTQAKMVTLWGALKSMERTLLARLRDRVDAINAATTKEEVDAIVW
jgi:hypothetical protein